MRIFGIPLTPESASEEFLTLLKDPSPRILFISTVLADPSNNDYMCAKAGFDALLDAGYKFVTEIPTTPGRYIYMRILWQSSEGRRRDGAGIAKDILAVLEDLEFKGWQADYITMGDPRFGDTPCQHMIAAGVPVFPCPSSVDLAYEASGSKLEKFVADAENWKLGCANVFALISGIYRVNHAKIANIIESNGTRVQLVHLGPITTVTEVDPAELARVIRAREIHLNYSTAVVEM